MISCKNPILNGFYPDPSICRVGEWFYLVTFYICLLSRDTDISKQKSGTVGTDWKCADP